MLHIKYLLSGLAILPAACSPSGSTGHDTSATSNVADQVLHLPPGQQRGVLYRAVVDVGLECQKLTMIVPMPPERGKPSWIVRCDDGRYHFVSIEPGGVADVSSRSGLL